MFTILHKSYSDGLEFMHLWLRRLCALRGSLTVVLTQGRIPELKNCWRKGVRHFHVKKLLHSSKLESQFLVLMDFESAEPPKRPGQHTSEAFSQFALRASSKTKTLSLPQRYLGIS